MLYNNYLAKLDNYHGSRDVKLAVHEILTYLRDHDQFAVPMLFDSSSELHEVSDAHLSIQPISQAFESEKRIALQQSVVDSVAGGFSALFPSDILSISNTRVDKNQPAFLVAYTYRNSDFVYYPTSQESMPIEKRDLYYGLKIDWNISILIPNHKNLDIANLESEPAPLFKVSEEGTEAIYRAMARTAFQDLTTKLTDKLFPK